MALALTVDAVFPTIATLDVHGSITASGSYAAHGDTLDFSGNGSIPSDVVPIRVEVFESPAAGTSPSGYVYNFCPGTGLSNGKVTVFEGGGASAPLAELAAGAYPAGITGAAIKFRATFKKF